MNPFDTKRIIHDSQNLPAILFSLSNPALILGFRVGVGGTGNMRQAIRSLKGWRLERGRRGKDYG
jgi:hypothetical protein